MIAITELSAVSLQHHLANARSKVNFYAQAVCAGRTHLRPQLDAWKGLAGQLQAEMDRRAPVPARQFTDELQPEEAEAGIAAVVYQGGK